MNKREQEITEHVIEILKKYLDPKQIILFGSRAKKNNTENADFDFAVEADKPDITLQRKINTAIEKVSGLYSVDIVFLPSVDKAFRNIIIKTGQVLYERRA